MGDGVKRREATEGELECFAVSNRRDACTDSLATFSFGDVGAKEKVYKKKTHIGGFRPLRRARRASHPPPAQTFEKV